MANVYVKLLIIYLNIDIFCVKILQLICINITNELFYILGFDCWICS